MRKNLIKAVCAVCLLATWAAAQAPAGPPKPGPELKRLNYYSGAWSSEGTTQASDFGPAGKFAGKEHNEWFPGGFFLVSHAEMTMGKFPMKEFAIFGYDTQHKVYTYHAINSVGEAETFTGTVNGSDWTWISESTMNGKTMKSRFLSHEDSPTAYTMKFEGSTDGGKTWKTFMEGKAKKGAAK